MNISNSDLTIEAVEITDMSLDAECVLERAQVASAAVSTMPFLGTVGAYNKHWHVDAVSLPHNAIRKILSTLFSITSSLHTLALDTTVHDVDLFAHYVHHCANFFTAVLSCEESALYAEAETGLLRRVDLGGAALSPGARAETRRKLLDRVTALRAVARDAKNAPALHLATRARAALLEFCTPAQAYFRAKERALPRVLVKRFRGPRGKNKIEGRTIEILSKQEHGVMFCAMLVCSLGSNEVVEEIAARHFKDDGKRAQFLKARHTLFQRFLQIPAVFENAAAKYSTRFSVDRFLEEYGKGRPRDEVVALVGQ